MGPKAFRASCVTQPGATFYWIFAYRAGWTVT